MPGEIFAWAARAPSPIELRHGRDPARMTDVMSRTLEEIATEAMELTPDARAALAKQLLDSLAEPTPEEVEKSWVAEANRRYRELQAGKSRAFPSEEVFERLESRRKR